MAIGETAREFFEACETGRGWAGCQDHCHASATFAFQADALGEVTSVEGYAEWMKGLLGPIPDGHYELKSFSTDAERGNVVATAVFYGTQTGEDGPGTPTGKTVAADYAYVMDFDGDKIRHVTKIWKDVHSLKPLGWA